MKKLHIIAWIICLLGFVFKFPHYPGASLLMIFGVILLLIHCVLFFIKNKHEKLPEAFLHLALVVMTLYLICRLNFWNCGPMIMGFNLLFLISAGISIAALILNAGNTKALKLPQIILICYFLGFVWISFIHSDRIFYFFNLNEITHKENRIENYKSWDKYSWFLYIVNKQDEALEANRKAQRIIEEKLKAEQPEYLLNDLESIRKHNDLIKGRNWIDYR